MHAHDKVNEGSCLHKKPKVESVGSVVQSQAEQRFIYHRVHRERRE